MRRIGSSLVAVVLMIVTIVSQAPDAKAAEYCAFGRNCYVGYFSGSVDYYGDDVVPGGLWVSNYSSFVGRINAMRNSGDWRNRNRSAFIIATMLGYNGGSISVSSANALYPQWESMVKGYSDAGMIDWNWSWARTCGQLNTFMQTGGDVAFYRVNRSESGFPDCASTTLYFSAIRFRNPSGSSYIIKKDCGNPVGDMSRLENMYNHEVTITGPSGQLDTNRTYCFRATTTKTSGYSSDRGNMWVELPSGVTLVSADGPYTYPYNGRNILWPNFAAGGISIPTGTTYSKGFCVSIDWYMGGQTIRFNNNWWPKTQNGETATASLTRLVRQSYSITPDLRPGGGAPAAPGPISTSNNYTLLPCAINSGTMISDPLTITLTVPTGVNFVSASSGGSYNSGTRRVTWIGARVAPGATDCNRSITYTPVTPGAEVTFVETVSPTGPEGGSASDSITYRIMKERYPSIQAWGSDVHAGGGFFNTSGSCVASGAGNITGNSKARSYGEYVVSARGSLNAFGSDNSAADRSASIGYSGGYYTVCRPDLVKVATDYINRGVGYTTIPSAKARDLDMGDTSVFNHDGVYYYSGGDVTITGGNYRYKITLVVLGSGRVYINEDVKMDSSVRTIAKNQPSLGIITPGLIIFRGTARDVDAYLFTNSTINTCYEGAASVCTNTLYVNGFLMGQTIQFRRLGPVSSAGTAVVTGERVSMTGQLYTNPPMLFGSLVSGQLIQLMGERPPLY